MALDSFRVYAFLPRRFHLTSTRVLVERPKRSRHSPHLSSIEANIYWKCVFVSYRIVTSDTIRFDTERYAQALLQYRARVSGWWYTMKIEFNWNSKRASRAFRARHFEYLYWARVSGWWYTIRIYNLTRIVNEPLELSKRGTFNSFSEHKWADDELPFGSTI